MATENNITLNASELHIFYKHYFSYYNTLEPAYQNRFTERCLQFISDKRIIGAENFEPDNRVKAIIAASAVQLTLGLDTWDLDYFETIVIHPSDFDDAKSGLKFRGETNLAGFIRLSWKGFLQGYKIGDDNINLGLHEFSHALRFNSIRGNGQDYFTEHYFSSWLASAYTAFYDIKNNRQHVFRKYGGANINEFISVCIEHYFESPADIKEHYPLLYLSTGILLNQVTQNGHTQLGVRQTLLHEKNQLLPGFSEKVFFVAPDKTALAACVMGALFFAGIASEAGITSVPGLVLLTISLLAWLRFDLRYRRFLLYERELIMQKGFFFFKYRKKTSIPVSHILSVRAMGENVINDLWEFTYYNADTDFFYEEELTSHNADQRAFANALLQNKIMYFK